MSNMAIQMDKEAFASERDLDLTQYFRVLWRYKGRILLFSMLVTAIAVAVLLNVQPMYRAQARLLLESQQAKAVSIEDVYGLDSSRQEYLKTQFEIIKSRHLAERVIDRLELTRHPEFIIPERPPWQDKILSLIPTAPNQDPMEVVRGWLSWLPVDLTPESVDEAQRLATRKVRLFYEFSKRLTVSPVPQTQLVDVGFYAHNPSLAALVANTMGEIYIENHLEAKLAVTRKASEWLSSRLDELLVGLRNSEEKLQAFREREGLLELDGSVGTASKEINELTEQLGLARQRREEARSLLNLVRRKGSDNIDSLEGLAEISGHPLIEQVKQAEVTASANVAELSRRYGPKHNKMIAAKAQLAEVRANMRAQVRQLVRGIEQEFQTLDSAVMALERQLGGIKSQYQEQSRVEVEYRELQREVESNRRIYETFLNRMKETGAVADFDAAHARFTDRAEPPLYPSKPKKKLIVIMVAVMSGLLGCAFALVYHTLTDTITAGDQVESKLSAKLLGAIPQQKARKRLKADHFFSKEAHSFSEAWRTVRTGYLLTHVEDGAKTLCVTSTVPGEGKTTSSFNLALALSQLERVLLIEADLRKPVVGEMLRLPNYQPGLSNLLSGTHKLNDCLYTVPDTELDVMVAGTRVSTPLELIASKSFSTLLERLQGHYDRILVDTAPVDVVSDALVIARRVDSVVYVVKCGKARRDLIARSLGRLFAAQARVDGVVLNGVPKDLATYKRYQSYYGTGMP
ncbi:polysaccharide biosynthesis tyrosine autokinase [Ferrimonas sediminicola]|uniref:non-specific protein-tyrosine kinase n=1 Tax=Ferrimonas sediminicola TaxID=2569538 RepID=A0A4V5NUX3_9GAMM|nr:polysaccharide biosynthesis tyrosine autokinase [Ferrimonas sediminicola]TKB48199.1 polysaccharide biosynthesis tyrosine autokinase [Ferrimonas sediminicola]